MAEPKLSLMISSRCETEVQFGDASREKLSTIRKNLQKEIEAEPFFGKPLVDVWINETETKEGSHTSWEVCIKQAKDCDFFISLFNGEAGWQEDKSGIGICHAEFETAHGLSPGKVRVVSLIEDSAKAQIKPGPDLNFNDALERANLLKAQNFADVAELEKRVKELVREFVLQLAHKGAREVKKSGPNTGQALDWSRMNFVDRKNKMVKTLVASLSDKDKAKLGGDGDTVSILIKGKRVLFRLSAIPASFTVPAAREMVGQPFLRDHELLSAFGSRVGGPVHIIACQKNVTEAQAMSLLGFPDATIVSGSFGVYVADNIQKIQLCLIANCRDAASTRHGMQKLFDWLQRTGEDVRLAKRAASRFKILKTIAEELK